jgi:hypothetical protein
MSNLIIRLTWSQTNDYFEIKAEDPEFAVWFVEQSSNLGNSYGYTGERTVSYHDNLIAELKNNIQEANQFLRKINFPELLLVDDFCSQHNLNLAHKSWIAIQRKDPRIDQLFYHHSPELFKKYHTINTLIHRIESSFKYDCKCDPHWRIDNKFKNTLPKHGLFNVSINYTDWGKSSWDKFLNGDPEPNDYELNNWNSIGSDININLNKPHLFTFPSDYNEYCEKHQIEKSVATWPLGNLVDYDNTMPTARNIMNKNIQIPNNTLQFSIAQ